jgi:hypothetical protein
MPLDFFSHLPALHHASVAQSPSTAQLIVHMPPASPLAAHVYGSQSVPAGASLQFPMPSHSSPRTRVPMHCAGPHGVVGG